MPVVLVGADVRSYYAALGITIPAWAQLNAAVRCFANPAAHTHGDRNPSCSVNLEHGAWNCHGCGAKGGAYDAATLRGCSPRDAIDLMVAFGLTEQRPHRRRGSRDASPHPPASTPQDPAPRTTAAADLSIGEHDLIGWQSKLAANPRMLDRLKASRGWTYEVIEQLGLGLDRGQITIPTRSGLGQLNGLLRYRPFARPGEPKLVAESGSQRTLFPHPTREPSPWILLVEGEPDMIAARSCGLPAIAIPGANAWKRAWAYMFAGRYVSVIVDADDQGRALGRRVAADLARIAQPRVVDLVPERADGYDLTDWLLENGNDLR